MGGSFIAQIKRWLTVPIEDLEHSNPLLNSQGKTWESYGAKK